MHRARYEVLLSSLFVVFCSGELLGQHEGDVFVGRSAAGQLTVGGFIPDLNIVVLPPVSSPPGLFNGWSDNNPGFDRVIIDDIENDLLTLQSGVQVRIEVVEVDPAFQAISPSFVIIDEPGERVLLGGQSLHTHLIWLINSDHAQFDPMQVLWRATFRLVDTGTTGYAASDPFTFYFADVACVRGDMSGDGEANGGDIPAFVETVLDAASASAEARCAADTDQDGFATVDDVASFVDAVLGV